MRKIFIIIGVIVCFLFILLFNIYNSQDVNFNDTLRKNIIEKIKKDEKITLNNIADFKWDYMLILSPYTPVNMIMDENGVKNYNKYKKYISCIEFKDDINLLVFIKDNKIIESVDIPRNECDFNLKKSIKVTNTNTFISKKENGHIKITIQ